MMINNRLSTFNNFFIPLYNKLRVIPFHTGVLLFTLTQVLPLIGDETLNAPVPENLQVLEAQKNLSGEIYLSSAKELFLEKNYSATIQKLKEFLIIYNSHPKRLQAKFLIKEAFIRLKQPDQAIPYLLSIYKENPVQENGLNSYLEAGKLFIATGEIKRGIDVLKDVKSMVFASKFAKEADTELELLKIQFPEYFLESNSDNQNKRSE